MAGGHIVLWRVWRGFGRVRMARGGWRRKAYQIARREGIRNDRGRGDRGESASE